MKKTFYIIAFITMTFLCNAQTSYVYVNPDSCVCVTSTYNTADTLITNWDLDKDGTNDFQIVVESYMSDCMHGFELTSLNALGNNKIAGDSLCTNSCNYAFMLNAGDTISKQPSWLSSSTLEYFNEFSGWYGHWKDSLFPNTIKFAGIKFYSGATLYYGWLRLNVVATCELARVLVIDYAYSTSPDSCLASVLDIKKSNSLLIYPNPNNGSFKLRIDNQIDNAELILSNFLGQNVFQHKIVHGDNIINTVGLPAGLYNYIVLCERKVISNGRLVIE